MVLPLVLVSLSGLLSLLLMTSKWGIGITPDSIGYILAAESYFHGKGLLDIPRFAGDSVPFTRHGPVFSLMVWAMMFLTGGQGPQAARFIQALLFFANIALAGRMTYHYTRSRWTSLTAAWMMMTSLVMLEIHGEALSEPVFILTGMLGFYFLSFYFEKNFGKTRDLLFAMMFFSVSILSRYAGVSIAAALGLAILVFGKGGFFRRLRTAMLAGGISLIPMVCWVLRNYKMSQSPGFPSFKCEPYFLINLWELGANSSIWLLPASVPTAVRAVVLASGLGIFFLMGAYVFIMDRNPRGEATVRFQPVSLPWILLVFIFCHLAVHFLSSVFVDPDELSNRHLSPVYTALLLCACMFTYRVWRKAPFAHLRKTIPLMALLFVLSAGARAAAWGINAYENGLMYASPMWSRSELMAKIRQLPADIPVYTNGLDIVYWFTRRPAQGIPDKLPEKTAGKPTALNPEILKQMTEDMQQHQAVLAYFDTIYWRYYYYPTLRELQAALPLKKIESASDGGLYRLGTPKD